MTDLQRTAPEHYVRVVTSDASRLVPILLQLNAAVVVRGRTVEVRGLTARQVALIAASQMVAASDLTTVAQ